jgi:cobalamin biosynthesis Mg chelatase CobN
MNELEEMLKAGWHVGMFESQGAFVTEYVASATKDGGIVAVYELTVEDAISALAAKIKEQGK